ncbi:MAG: AAA family ATPase [Gemmatimonadales bacterium]
MLIDREAEAAEFHALADSGHRKLALLYGRRRVGKTYLLTQLWDTGRAFYFTASATSPEINRRVLIEEAARWASADLRPEDHPTWRTVFRTLLELSPDRNLVLIIDEFQYLAANGTGLAEVVSELNAVWEGQLGRRAGLLLILSGSAVGTLEALAAGGSPLYGRLDWVRQLHPFDYWDAAQMVPAYAPIDRIRTYAAFGGLPKYLQAVDDRRPLAENIVRLLLSPHGEVRLQVETVLQQEEGLRDHAQYHGILAAVGLKRRGIGPIAAALGREADTALRRMVGQLVELDFLESERNFEESKNQAIRYRIADPALRFHFGLVLPNESAIASAGADIVWRERLADQAFPAYAGKEVFEDIARQAYRRHHTARDLPAVERWGRWEGQDRHRRDIEIDIVARLLDGRIMTGAVKFQRRLTDASVLLEHLDVLRRLADDGRRWASEALQKDALLFFVSSAPFKASFHDVARNLDQQVVTWTMDDLL